MEYADSNYRTTSAFTLRAPPSRITRHIPELGIVAPIPMSE